MMFRHVMVPYDGSDHAKNALNYAKDLVAGDADAKLSVVQCRAVQLHGRGPHGNRWRA